MRPTDLYPREVIDELLRCARLDRKWVRFEHGPSLTYRAYTETDTWLRQTWFSGADAFAMLAGSVWLLNGPKVFIPTLEQQAALEQVELRLHVSDYSQPFSALLVKVDIPPFIGVTCYHDENLIVAVLHSVGHLNDITTTIVDKQVDFIETSVCRFDNDCKDSAPQASRALRVALNSCLALSNYGCHCNYLYPKEVARDQKSVAKDRGDHGKHALKRLALAVQRVSFDNVVHLHRTEGRQQTGETSGRSVGTHWRRGHWRSQHYGIGNTQVKQVLIAPVLVRADLFTGETSDTTTTYR